MLLQSTIGKTALMIENEMFRGLHTEVEGMGKTHAPPGSNREVMLSLSPTRPRRNHRRAGPSSR